ncbi:MAG: GNAT family N-acetyltransferase [Sneathiella sp.]|nr:GNAT family N-acetyltransferase [Sneathiella sp.]
MLGRYFKLSDEKPIQSAVLYLRSPRLSDWKAWSSLRMESRQYLMPWEPSWGINTLSKSSFKARLRQYTKDAKADTGHAFFIFRKSDDQFIGGITLSNIRRGVAQTGTIGYWTGQRYARNGYMLEGLSLLLPELFNRFRLRRIEAACLPDNVPSASLLKKAGFRYEGRARQYLCINGAWQDHLLFAMLKSDNGEG